MAQDLQVEVDTRKIECETLLQQVTDATLHDDYIVKNSRDKCIQLEREVRLLQTAKATLEHTLLMPDWVILPTCTATPVVR